MNDTYITPADGSPAGQPAPVGTDAVVPFAVEALEARGRAVLLGPSLDAVLSRHDYPEPVGRLLGETVVLTVLLGTSLKFEGKFILQAQTDGPVTLLVVDFATPDSVRAYARFDADAVETAIAEGRTRPEDLLGHGTLALTVDQGSHMQRYQGIVQLDGASLEQIARNYFRQSEQLPTELRMAVGRLSTRGPDGALVQSWRAGGVLVQFLPEAPERMRTADLHPGDAPPGAEIHQVDDDDAWAEVKALVGTIDDDELIDDRVGVHALLYRLFHERGVRVFDAKPVTEKCTCSREKVRGVLTSLDPSERESSAQDGKIVITCEFCSTVYEFGLDELGD